MICLSYLLSAIVTVRISFVFSNGKTSSQIFNTKTHLNHKRPWKCLDICVQISSPKGFLMPRNPCKVNPFSAKEERVSCHVSKNHRPHHYLRSRGLLLLLAPQIWRPAHATRCSKIICRWIDHKELDSKNDSWHKMLTLSKATISIHAILLITIWSYRIRWWFRNWLSQTRVPYWVQHWQSINLKKEKKKRNMVSNMSTVCYSLPRQLVKSRRFLFLTNGWEKGCPLAQVHKTELCNSHGIQHFI